jgi:predicted phosphodiesterase
MPTNVEVVMRVMVLVLAAIVAACPTAPAPAPAPSPVASATAPATAPSKDAMAAANAAGAANGTQAVDLPVDRPTSSEADCVGRIATTPVQSLLVGGKTYERVGSTVTLKGGDADDEFVLGQLSDIKDHNPDNAANLQKAVDWFKTQRVDAIAISGDVGESAASIQAVLETVGAAAVPVLVVIGNRETRMDFVAGVTAAQAKFPGVINMNQVRVFNTDDVSVVSLPGYYNRRYLYSGDGCAYTKSDVAEVGTLATSATGANRVLLSHGPPRQAGANAIDRIHEGANVGDPEITELLKKGLYPFGMFGNILEAGGRGTDVTGSKRIGQETWTDALYLNPGPMDAVPWNMIEGPPSRGMAAIMKFKGKQASYQIFRVVPAKG